MTGDNRKYELKESQIFTEFSFVWVNNLKFIDLRKSDFFFHLQYSIFLPGAAVPSPNYVNTLIGLEREVDTFNLLKPTGHVMHHQFNIQQLYVLPTLYLCVLYVSENKQRLVPLTA